MARQPRKQSATGIYHVMLRGINRQRIFEDPGDYGHFLQCLVRAVELGRARVLAYALMSNHVHLLIEEGLDPLSVTVKRAAVRYAQWYNRKYDRVGHLFQDRFISRPVETDGYVLMALLYIAFNPVAAGLCSSPPEYPWSSRRWLGRASSLVDEERLAQLVPIEVLVGEEARYDWRKAADPLESEPEGRHMDDDDAFALLAGAVAARNASEFQRLPVERQRAGVLALRARQVTCRQVARLTGLSRMTIARWSTNLDVGDIGAPGECVP